MLEAQVKAEIKKRLNAVGWEIIDTSLPSGGYKQLEGIPDLICIRRDHVVFLEVKAPGGKIRDSQIAFLARIAPHLGNHIYHKFIDLPDLIPPWMLKP